MPEKGIITVSKHGISALQISNLNAFIHRLAEGFTPTTPQRKRERFSKNSDELFAEKDWRNATYGDNKNISDTHRC